jgi:hypothetical protein
MVSARNTTHPRFANPKGEPMNFDFGEVLARAWKIIWKHKVLWIFGILASCGSNGGRANSNSQTSNGNYSNNPLPNKVLQDLSIFFQRAEQWFKDNPWVIFAIIGVVLILWTIQIFLTIVGRTGLIRGAYHAEMGVEKLRFGELFRESLGYFWRVFGLSLIVGLPIIVFLVGMVAVLVFDLKLQTTTHGSEIASVLILFFLAFCCCLIPIMLVIGLYYSQAERAVILENKGVFSALVRGWRVFRENIVGLFAMGLLLGVANMIISIIIGLPALIVVMPLMISFMNGNIQTWQPFIVAGALLCLYTPIAWVLNGIAISYIQTVWTLIYMSVTKQPVVEEPNNPIIIEANA